MPFKSKAQQAYLFANKPSVAKEFASKTPKSAYSAMPEHVKRRVARLTKKYRLKGPLQPGDLIAASRKAVKRKIVDAKGPGNTLAETTMKGSVPQRVEIFKKSHGKDKKKSRNRLIDTMVHEEYHIKHPKATEKETYKATAARKVKKMSRSAKQKLYDKYSKKSKKAVNFGSKAKYNKWLAYGHMHGDFAKSPGNTPVKIKGQSHNVNHK